MKLKTKLKMKSQGRPVLFDREEVLKKSVRLFWTYGYDNVSTDQICKVCNLSKPSLYNSFGTKEDFFIACLEEYNRSYVFQLLSIMKSHKDLIEGVDAMLRVAAQQFQSSDFPRGCLAITGLVENIGKSKKIDKQLKIIQTSFVKEFETYFNDRCNKKQKVKSKELSHYIIGQLYAMAVFSRSNAELFNFENFVIMSRRSLESLLQPASAFIPVKKSN